MFDWSPSEVIPWSSFPAAWPSPLLLLGLSTDMLSVAIADMCRKYFYFDFEDILRRIEAW